jgi:hypothetical protein
VVRTQEDLRLVERDPVPHPVREPVHDEARVLGEPVHALPIKPAAAAEERLGVIPVEECDPRLNAGLEQAVHETVVERQARFVDSTSALGKDSGPGDRKAVRAQADLAHEADILGVAVIMVAGDIAVWPMKVAPGRWLKTSHTDGPLPSASCAPSI